jgi:hypothetical protein
MPPTTTRSSSRLAAARTRRMLEDSAIAAAGGGRLVVLEPDPADAACWRADVRRGDGALLRLRLDRRTAAVEMEPVTAAARAA